MIPENLLYTKEHEWVLLEGSKAKVGITHHAQAQLGDVVYVELPKSGSAVKQMVQCGIIESVKAVSELFSPLTGKIAEVNAALQQHPENVNTDPYGDGWMFVIETSDKSEFQNLLKPSQYRDLVGGAH